MPLSGRTAARFIDIGANLVDSMYSGVYHGSRKHDPDLDRVLNRAWDSGLEKIIITGTSLEESKAALNLSRTEDKLYCTVGCHPTNCSEFEKVENSSNHLSSLADLIKNNKDKVAAIGEFGLDYDRLHFCPKDTQKKWFEEQLIHLAPLGLPLFLHCRNAATDLIDILKRNEISWAKNGGVVHSFTGSAKEAEEFTEMGLYIGINGCSLKTSENLEVVKLLNKDRILLETDAPWCEIKSSHAGYKFCNALGYQAVKKEKWRPDATVKGRNEPCSIRQVLEIIARVRDEDYVQLSEQCLENTLRLFFRYENS